MSGVWKLRIGKLKNKDKLSIRANKSVYTNNESNRQTNEQPAYLTDSKIESKSEIYHMYKRQMFLLKFSVSSYIVELYTKLD